MHQKIVTVVLTLYIFLAFSFASVQAGGVINSNFNSLPVYEIETQLPCFLYGGYQLSVGKRYQHFRFRVSVVNSGRADFENNGIDRKNTNIRRTFDTGSFSMSADYFLNSHWFSFITLQNNRWLLRNNETLTTDHIHAVEAGLGTGWQHYFYKNIFVQLSFQVNFRDKQSITMDNENYTIPGIDWTPGVRLGVRF